MEQHNIAPYNGDNPQTNYYDEEAYLRAKKRVDKIVGFYWHLAVYIVVNLFIIGLNIYYTGTDFFNFGTFSTAIFWGIGLLFHCMSVYGPNFIFGKNWENRQIAKYMKDDKNRWE